MTLAMALRVLSRAGATSEVTAFMVGGAVRDRLLGRDPRDLDVVVTGDAVALARAAADAADAAFMVLDAERGFGRVVGPDWVIDVTPIASDGTALFDDLGRRDFTINAMAMPLWAWVAGLRQPLIDPFEGAKHLAARKLVFVTPTALAADPVRALRALRFSERLGMRPAIGGFAAIREAVPLLPTVSAERVRDELMKLLDGTSGPPGLLPLWLRDLGLLQTLLPEVCGLRGVPQSPPHELDAFDHTVRVAIELDFRIIPQDDSPPSWVDLWLDGAFEDGVTRRALLRLAAFLHDIGKAADARWDNGRWTFHGHEDTGAECVARDIVPRLRLGNRAAAFLCALVRHHMRPANLARDGGSARALARFFRETGENAPGILLLALADRAGKSATMSLAAGGDAPLDTWLFMALDPAPSPIVRPASPLSGDEIMQRLALRPGPLVGRIKAALADMWAAGEIKDRADAEQKVVGILAEFAK